MFAASIFLFLTANILQEYASTKTLGLWRGDWLLVSFAGGDLDVIDKGEDSVSTEPYYGAAAVV